MPRPLVIVDAASPADRAPRAAVPVRDSWLAAAALAWRLRRSTQATPALHTRDAAGLKVAALCPRDWPIVHRLWDRPSPEEAPLLRRLAGSRPISTRCATESIACRVRQLGFTSDRATVDSRASHWPTDDNERASSRAALHLLPSQRALLLTDDITWHSGHRVAAIAAALATSLDPSLVVILGGHGPAADATASLVHNLTLPGRFRRSPLSASQNAAAADAVVLGPGDACDLDTLVTLVTGHRPVFAAREPSAMPPGLPFVRTGPLPRELAAAIVRHFA